MERCNDIINEDAFNTLKTALEIPDKIGENRHALIENIEALIGVE